MSGLTINEKDEDEIPTREECQNLVEQFVSITGTDAALAQFFLQDRNWKLEPSINAFYEESKNEVNIVTNDDDPDVLVTFDSGFGNLLSDAKYTISTEPPKKFKLLTWNIDGLDDRCLKKRTKAILDVILREKPDVVTLQEVIPISFSYLEQKLPQYKCIASKDSDYFTATFIKITTVKFDAFSVKDFPNSVMGRDLLIVEAHIGSLKLKILNSHLESTAEYTKERKCQLREAFSIMKNCNEDVTSILAGDLNLRDKEVHEVSLPREITDMWEECGRRSECQYTWDMQRNCNKEFPGRFKPRCRFDRIYLRNSEKSVAKPTFFGLVGIEKVKTTQIFPSDHWGIVVDYDIINQNVPEATKSTCITESIKAEKSTSKKCITESVNEQLDSMEVENSEPESPNRNFKRRLEEIDTALNGFDESIVEVDAERKSLNRTVIDLESD